jgi:hypothetical protein
VNNLGGVRMPQEKSTDNANQKERNEFLEKWRKKLDGAVALKDYAISNNFYVVDDIIQKLNDARSAAHENKISEHATKIDTAIRDLTEITFPTTIETLSLAEGKDEPVGYKYFKRVLIMLSLFAIFISIYSYDIAFTPAPEPNRLWLSIFAASLGLLGAIIYILFNVIGILSERAFNADDAYANYARVVIGPLIGWVFYFGFAQEAFSKGNGLLLILPFLAGFSTKLVIGVIYQAITAIELTLGLEEKGEQLMLRRKKRKAIMVTESPK